jgi:hypothetical protein
MDDFDFVRNPTGLRILDPGHVYEIGHLGQGSQIIRFAKRSSETITYKKEWPGLQTSDVLNMLINRTEYLNNILPCVETQDALYYLRMIGNNIETATGFRILDPGHVYEVYNLGGGSQIIRFVKRSGGAITHRKEWSGLQTQGVLRALIDKEEYLNDVSLCEETQESSNYLRMALFMYEVRAYRRKMESVNRKQPAHDDGVRPKSWHENPFADVPFNEHEIELRPIGPDGHILLKEEWLA